MSRPPAIAVVLAIAIAFGLQACRGGGSGAPSAGGSATAWFEEIAARAGISFVHTSGHATKHLLPEIMGGGAALFDYDNDGFLDLYLVQSGTLNPDANQRSADARLKGSRSFDSDRRGATERSRSFDSDRPDSKDRSDSKKRSDLTEREPFTRAETEREPFRRASSSRLYHNRGNGTFEDVTERSGAGVGGYGMGVTAGDFDNDGFTDLFVTNFGANVLLRNDGHGHFADVTAKAGVAGSGWSTSAAFVDYDADGWPDLFVTRYLNWKPAAEIECYSLTGVPDYCSPASYDLPAASILYHNNGDGTFTDVSVRSGIAGAVGNGLGVVAGDFDGDGRIDLFVANDRTPNHLWMNRGGGRFEEAALAIGTALDQDGTAKSGMGVDAVDVDDDGDLDLLVVNLDGEADSFFRNRGRFFSDDTAAVGLRTASRPFTRFGAGFVDFDNDGYLDLFEANGRVGMQSERYAADPYAEPSLLFRGLAGPRFEEVRPRGGTAQPLVATSRAAAFGDIDNDGGVDVVVVNRDSRPYLLHNVVKPRGHWLLLRVEDEHGRDAIGAQVTTRVGTRTIRRDVRAAYSYLASNDPRVHVGLGTDGSAREVIVRWPDGKTESFANIPADRITTLRRNRSSRP